jgi:hypothetical protein
MGHMRLDKVTSREGRAEGKLASENCGADDARKLAGIVARVCRMGPTHAEQIEHSQLRF